MGVINELRMASHRFRPRLKPTFIIVGAQKAGTTALHKMLTQHPQIVPPTKKEIDYFNNDTSYAKGMQHYGSHFPVTSIKKTPYITFEASPGYLLSAEKAAPRIRKDLPDTTCIAILRDPVKRAFSAWNMYRDFKDYPAYVHLHDPRTFEQAVEDELAGRTERYYHKYLANGEYSRQLAPFLAQFPKEQLIIRSYLQLKNEPLVFIADLCDRFNLPPLPEARALTKKRVNTRPYTEPLDAGLASELYQYFAPELVKLREVLGYDLPILENHG